MGFWLIWEFRVVVLRWEGQRTDLIQNIESGEGRTPEVSFWALFNTHFFVMIKQRHNQTIYI